MDKENNPYNYSASTLKALARFGSVNASSINPTSKPEPLPLPGADHRQALGVLGLKRVSVAPEPITPVRGSSYTQPRTPATLPAIDWRYWRHMPEIRQWEACALSLNINPDNMKHHPQAWMAGPGSGPIFTDASFPNKAVQIEFDKRVRLLGASLFSSGYFTAVNNLVMGGRHLATVNLREFAAWALHVEFDGMPPELVAMAEKKPEPMQAVTPETKEQRQDRRLKACIDAGLPMNTKAALSRLPDGVGDVADREGVTRQTFSTDVKAALMRRENAIREGRTAHRA